MATVVQNLENSRVSSGELLQPLPMIRFQPHSQQLHLLLHTQQGHQIGHTLPTAPILRVEMMDIPASKQGGGDPLPLFVKSHPQEDVVAILIKELENQQSVSQQEFIHVRS